MIVKRRDLVRRIAQRSAELDVSWRLLRQGAGHEVFILDGQNVLIPRHRELNEITALAILKQCEAKLGTRWWRV